MYESERMTERHQDVVGHQISGKFSDTNPDTTKWIFSLLYSHKKKKKTIKHH